MLSRESVSWLLGIANGALSSVRAKKSPKKREMPVCVLKVLEFIITNPNRSWHGSVGELIEADATKDVSTATFGKFLAQYSAFMRLSGVAYRKKHTSAGQAITLELVACKGSENNEVCC